MPKDNEAIMVRFQLFAAHERWISNSWMHKLRPNDWLVLPKNNDEEAVVSSIWSPPAAGGSTGIIYIDRYNAGRHFKGTERWCVAPNGCGFDGLPLMRPQCTFEELMSRPDPELPDLLAQGQLIRQLVVRVQRLEAYLRNQGVQLPEMEITTATSGDDLPQERLLGRRPRSLIEDLLPPEFQRAVTPQE